MWTGLYRSFSECSSRALPVAKTLMISEVGILGYYPFENCTVISKYAQITAFE
jgi:hypothetical protein